jgi:peptidoglycan-associated lipoprotein
MRNRFSILAAALSACALALGCAHEQAPPKSTAQETARSAPAPTSSFALTLAEVPRQNDVGKPVGAVYFAYDSAALSDEMRSTLKALAARLRDRPDVSLRIEGNCDERGGELYNEELGFRRAEAARRYLVAHGVDDSRITTVSFGADRFRYGDHATWAWDRNRRDDILLVSR